MNTHENYIKSVAGAAIARLDDAADRDRLAAVKLVYGAGSRMTRGVTYYEAWCNGNEQNEPLVEICAFGESDNCQIAGTTVHELAHVLAGLGHGHDKDWRAACATLGLRLARAAGHHYQWASFAPDLRASITSMPAPADGVPSDRVAFRPGGPVISLKPKPCSMGTGTRGGKSRGIGSGSRMLKVECPECGYVARVTAKWLAVGLPRCPDHDAMTRV